MICEALWVTAIINKLSITMLHEVLTSSIQLFAAILSLLLFLLGPGGF